jgi:hypothetical protein
MHAVGTVRFAAMVVASLVVAFVVVSWATTGGFPTWPTPGAPLPPPPPPPPVNKAVERGQEPWAANEHYSQESRRLARKSALEALDQPWSSFCSEDGRKNLIDSLNYYFGMRTQHQWSYTNTWGEAGARYIATVWTTADDNRIERLSREMYHNGYLNPADMAPYARSTINPLLRGERQVGKPCTS